MHPYCKVLPEFPVKLFVLLLLWVSLLDFLLEGALWCRVWMKQITRESLALHNGSGTGLVCVILCVLFIFKYRQCQYISTPLIKHNNNNSLFKYQDYRQYRYTPIVPNKGFEASWSNALKSSISSFQTFWCHRVPALSVD